MTDEDRTGHAKGGCRLNGELVAVWVADCTDKDLFVLTCDAGLV